MGEAKSFECPNCGAALTAGGAEKEVRCAFCGSSVIVPVELRDQGQASTREQFAAMLDKLGSQDSQNLIDIADGGEFDVIKNGADGVARVFKVDDLGAAANNNRSVCITLEVTPAEGEKFDILAMPDIPRSAFPRYWSKIQVKFNPDSKNDIAVLLNGKWYIEGGGE